jgi:hypothetical protein
MTAHSKVKTVIFQKNASQVYDNGCGVEEGVWLSVTYLYIFFPFALFEAKIVLTLAFVFVFIFIFIRPDEAWLGMVR